MIKLVASRHQNEAQFLIYEHLAEIPHFDRDIENTHLPGKVPKFRHTAASADRVLICTPEYVFSPPAMNFRADDASNFDLTRRGFLLVTLGFGSKSKNG
ncbi:MAG: hypothetical protein JNJ69_13460 [Leptospiraceae bacterium]|nr:hypothetical protein [Leptospiraceae bacterium]